MSPVGTTRVKISVSLPRELVARIDRAARAGARSRSRVLEGWLRASESETTARELEAATIAYYESLMPEERREDAAIGSASSRAGRRLKIDDLAESGPRRRRRR
jgi:metal-responsive CopG/Arc/MetJ family transcriptional regulator